jgi:multiple sugar transport system substrate-binding protein
MKKTIAVAASAAAVLAALTGCSAGAGGSSGSGGSGSGPVKLTVWTGFTGGDRPGYDQIVKDFNASHKNIQVSMTVQPWDTITQKLPSAWLTGSGPDIAAPSSDPNVIAQYVKTNSVLPLTDTGSGSKINVGQIAPALIKEYTYNGKLYAVPANYATLSLYYNKKMFAAAGISAPPSTLAEFEADAKKLTKPGGKQYGLVLADNQTIQMWPILQWLGGGDIVSSNNCSALATSQSEASLKPWVDMVVNDKISPVGLTGAQADSLFSAGKAAMEMNGPWAAPGYKSAGIDLGIAKIPAGADGQSVTLGSTAPLAISAKTKYPQQAQEFLAYWTSKTEQKKFSLTTGFPTLRTDLASDPALQANETIATFTAQVPDARLYLPKVPQATQVDANGYVPFIGQITRGQSLSAQAAAASKTINSLTACSS